jgi:hypothetical protein
VIIVGDVGQYWAQIGLKQKSKSRSPLMSEVTQEEKLEWLDAYHWAYRQYVYPIDEKGEDAAYNALRRLIEKIGEWQTRIVEDIGLEKGDDVMDEGGITLEFIKKLLEEIRDYGKEADNE